MSNSPVHSEPLSVTDVFTQAGNAAKKILGFALSAPVADTLSASMIEVREKLVATILDQVKNMGSAEYCHLNILASLAPHGEYNLRTDWALFLLGHYANILHTHGNKDWLMDAQGNDVTTTINSIMADITNWNQLQLAVSGKIAISPEALKEIQKHARNEIGLSGRWDIRISPHGPSTLILSMPLCPGTLKLNTPAQMCLVDELKIWVLQSEHDEYCEARAKQEDEQSSAIILAAVDTVVPRRALAKALRARIT